MIMAFAMITIAILTKFKQKSSKSLYVVAILLGILVIIPEILLFLVLGNYALYFVINVGSLFPFISGALAIISGVLGLVLRLRAK